MTEQHHSSTRFAYIGSYADAANPGLYTCTYDSETGKLSLIESASGLQNPTFLAVDESLLKLYALSENISAEGKRSGAIQAFDIHADTGKLTLLNTEASVTAPTCHISLDRTNQCAMVASYSGGLVGLSGLQADGHIGTIADMHQHAGSGIRPQQNGPHPHSVFVDRGNRFALVPDLGIDRIVVYALDIENLKLTPKSEVALEPGAGPRHLAYHPALPYVYVINELNSTVTAFSYEAEEGQLTEIQSISTLPQSYTGENSTADIHITADGRFLYGSNRGHDSIAVFAIDPVSGEMTFVEHASAGGKHPRNFALSPDDRFLIVANRDTDNVVTLARDAETGKLQPTGDVLELSKPVCVKFLTLA
ncbi:MAG: 3-carboxymuconate cyclase [Paenibacillus sp.]|nr:3-carboxymuconate cyclase [Paenibacillus sp.]